jgi:hypothetical protein
MPIPVENFITVDGSMTSNDGQTFYFHVRRDDGSELMLGFPHKELPNIIECAALQMTKGRAQDGEKVVTAFNTSGFLVGRGPEGGTVLSITVGGTGQIGFLLSPEMKTQLIAMLGRDETKH